VRRPAIAIAIEIACPCDGTSASVKACLDDQECGDETPCSHPSFWEGED
jgi:hypothetical protein